MKNSRTAQTKTTKAKAARAPSSSMRPASTSGPVDTLKVGRRAPAFSLPDAHGQKVRLSQFKGKKVVLYFYPKDDTPGCTREACSFRDAIDQIQAAGAVVLGMSADSVESHKKFSDKYHLPFPLLSDTDKTVLKAYGVWKEKSLYGRKFMGIERTTVIIDEKGKIAKVFPKVKVDSHVTEVLHALREMP